MVNLVCARLNLTKPFSYNLFRIVHCGQLAACAGTDTCDVKEKKPKTKPCNFQLDVSFVLRHQCSCFGQESCSLYAVNENVLVAYLVVKI